MRIAVTGSSGLVGSALVRSLRADGHEVVRLVRRVPHGPHEARWDPVSGLMDPGALHGVQACVHLAGAGIGDRRWTRSYRRELFDSRVLGTAGIARALAGLHPTPGVLLSGSAVGYYGDTGDLAVDETSPRGTGFLADLCGAWEHAASPARDAGVRTVHLRTGLVLSGAGGAWSRMFPLFRMGLGGRLGSGRQYWSFISLADEVAAIRHLLEADDVHGPANLTAPHPVTNDEVTATLAQALHRPAMLPVPAPVLRAALGGFGEEILAGQRALPVVLEISGFRFAHPTIRDVVAVALTERAHQRG